MNGVHAALIGITHPHSLAHLSTLQALPEVEVVSLWDEDREALEDAVRIQGTKVSAVYTDLDALLADDSILFAVAAVRNDLGPEVFVRALRAGKHLLAEKPIGRTAAETSSVIQAAQDSGLKLGVCYQNRNNPVVLDARRLVSAGAIGEIMSVEMRMLTTQVRFRNPSHWLFDVERSGGGILSWLGCHYIDMMCYITGEEIVSVAAETAVRSGESISVEDVAVLLLRFRSGAVGSFHAGYTLAMSGEGYHNKSGYDTYAGFNGRSGRIHWSGSGAPTGLSLESTHPDWSVAPQRSSGYELAQSPAYGGVAGEGFVRRFIEAARGDGEPMAAGLDALKVARVVDAAYESSRTGRRVPIE